MKLPGLKTNVLKFQSDLSTTPPSVMLPYTSIKSDLFTTSLLVVLPYTSIVCTHFHAYTWAVVYLFAVEHST